MSRRSQGALRVLIGTLVLVSALWGLLEWEVRQLESEVWTSRDTATLENREALLRWIVAHRLTPTRLRSRADGLLGDLEYGRGEFDNALEHYTRSMTTTADLRSGAQIDAGTLLTMALTGTETEFSRGYQAARDAPFVATPLGDEDLHFPERSAQSQGPDADWLLGLAPVSDPDMIRSHLYEARKNRPDFPGIEALCLKYRPMLDQLGALTAAPEFAPGVDGTELSHLPDIFRLLLLDAVAAEAVGDSNRAARSFRASGLLLNSLRHEPTVVRALVEMSLRGQMHTLLRTDTGISCQPYFERAFVTPKDAYNKMIRASYQASKQILIEAIAPANPAEERYLHSALERHRDWWRGRSKETGSFVRARDSLARHLTRMIFRHRQIFTHPRRATYTEGEQYYHAVEALQAEILLLSAVPNLGAMYRALEQNRARDLELLTPGQPPPSL